MKYVKYSVIGITVFPTSRLHNINLHAMIVEINKALS